MKKKIVWIGAIAVVPVVLIMVLTNLPTVNSSVEMSQDKSLRFGINDSEYQAGVKAYKDLDYATAIKKLQPLADQDHVQAQYYLGLIFAKSNDEPSAIEWYGKAADQGHIEAQHILAVMDKKAGNYREAARYYRKAADQGRAECQYELGLMYYEGRGVLQDYIKAHMWLNLAAAQNHYLAGQKRNEVAQSMTRDEIAEAQGLARNWSSTH